MSKQEERFFARVDKKRGCWNWTGGTGGTKEHTYGVYGGTTAHRWAYGYFVEKVPEDRVVDHLCGNKMCVNPAHLEVVTQRENLLRSKKTLNAINAAKTHCKEGHEFTEKNTYISVTNGQRVCRECKRLWAQGQRDRKKEGQRYGM